MKRQLPYPVEQHVIEREIHAGAWFRQTLRRAVLSGHVDPISQDIVDAVGRYAALQVSVLALTLVRYSELAQVDVHLLSIGESQNIIQPKTTLYRAVGLPWLPDPDHFPPDFRGVWCERLSYICLYAEMKRAIPAALARQLKGSKDVCHIFRHLRASWYQAQGYTDREIADTLGQLTLHATPLYLHPALYGGTV